MKKYCKKLSALVISAAVACAASFPASAGLEDDPADYGDSQSLELVNTRKVEDFFSKFTENTVFPKTKYILTENVTPPDMGTGEPYTIPKQYKLYIRNGGVLTIEKPARVYGTIVVERGGEIRIKNGASVEMDGILKNYGTITVEEGASLNLEGTYHSTASSELKADGTVRFYAERSASTLTLSKIEEKIAEFDSGFRPDSYCVSKRLGHVFLHYCIGDVKTDSYYDIALDASPQKIYTMKYPFDTVYDEELAEKLKKASEEFKKSDDYTGTLDDRNFIGIHAHFDFSFKTKVLSFEETGAYYGPADMEIDYEYSTELTY